MSITQNRIASQIAEAIGNTNQLTDIHIRQDSSLFFKGPAGLNKSTEAPVTRQEIEQFFDFLTEHRAEGDRWRDRIVCSKGDFNEAITVDKKYRLRVNGFYWGEKKELGASIRCQPCDVKNMDVLGVPEIMKFFLENKGLILVTGPTGAGKSTTIAAAIEYLNHSETPRNIITIEDPIEYEISSKSCLITQREVGKGYLASMADGVVSALRQNPDVIVVGEAREKDTISTMLRAAASGHLVLGSMHTNNARDTVEAILSVYQGEEVGVKAAALASRLVGVVSQQLVPRKDRKSFILATEVLIINNAVRNAIRTQDYTQFTNLMNESRESRSSYTLNSELAEMVRNDQVSKEDAIAATYDPDGLRKALGVIGS